MEEGLRRSEQNGGESLRVLEFYSGIGGMRYSMMAARVHATVIEAFEINDLANDVYEFNFGHRPFQGNIQSLTGADLDKYQAHAWFLSPPCQPYTRQGLQKDSSDARAFSFLNILELIPQLSHAPLMIFVENVVGFERSDTHSKLIEVLASSGYVTQEFILSPLQFGIPYSRPRYFCLAKRRPFSFLNSKYNHQLLYTTTPLSNIASMNSTPDQSVETWDETFQSCDPIERFLEFKCSEFSLTTINSTNESLELYGKTVGSDGGSLDEYLVPLSLIERWGSAMDIVYPDSKRSCCFTKSYYRYVKGTGSLLATIQPSSGVKGKASSLENQGLRFFTPREVANLHTFPKDLCFPEHVSLRQRYALLGNSLSIAVVAPLIKYLFTEPS